jgi:hypothetical protein
LLDFEELERGQHLERRGEARHPHGRAGSGLHVELNGLRLDLGAELDLF